MKAHQYNLLVILARSVAMLAAAFGSFLIMGLRFNSRATVFLLFVLAIGTLPVVFGIVLFTVARRLKLRALRELRMNEENVPEAARLRLFSSEEVMVWVVMIGVGCLLRWLR